MVILALDTTGRAGSVAVVRDGHVIHERTGNAGLTHGQRLPGDIISALAAAGVNVEQLDLLAVAVGPGSFTGLRVGLAAVQGIAVARGLAVAPISTLEALARTVERPHGHDLIAPWIDGQRGEVFAGLYDAGTAAEIARATVGRPEAVLEEWRMTTSDRSVVFIGDGALRYRTLLDERFGSCVRVLEAPPLASTLGRIAFEEPDRAVRPDAIMPLYIRRPDAELARDRRQGST